MDTSIEKAAEHRLRPLRKAHSDRTDFKPPEPGSTAHTITAAAADYSNPAVLVIGDVVRAAEANRNSAEAEAELGRLAASLMGARER